MPAVSTENILVLPRIPRPDSATAQSRAVSRVVAAHKTLEGAGFPVSRPFPGSVAEQESDPFLLLDHFGPIDWGPGEPKGAPWHPHRGFETVTYMLDGAFEHKDSTGGGGLITDGATQWMTAGSGILHDELPPQYLIDSGGSFHGLQLWVNLPQRLKMTPPRYQDIAPGQVKLLASDDGGALVRLIAGNLAGFEGPGVTWTPITYLHASLTPGAQLQLPWRADFNALVFVLEGQGFVGSEDRPLSADQMAVLGTGDAISLRAAADQQTRTGQLEVLILGGTPLREPVVFYGPFVMNTEAEIATAISDYRAGRLGTIPAKYLN
jgi:redox-sensitive bicupin YhaK (pirin superfamily)